ncbi:MAG: putative fructose-bisphosphate aldolase, partial [Gemmatimonadetes bacterium]|nr:putative fructose-bisphosphate aldolase [Gemmatimonadota bacterium]
HLATNFQNIVMDHPELPADLRQRILAWLDANAQGERKSGDTDEQFYYRARKRAIGPFKQEMWDLPAPVRDAIAADLEQTFGFLFDQLAVNGTAEVVRTHTRAPVQHHVMLAKVGAAADDPDAGE